MDVKNEARHKVSIFLGYLIISQECEVWFLLRYFDVTVCASALNDALRRSIAEEPYATITVFLWMERQSCLHSINHCGWNNSLVFIPSTIKNEKLHGTSLWDCNQQHNLDKTLIKTFIFAALNSTKYSFNEQMGDIAWGIFLPSKARVNESSGTGPRLLRTGLNDRHQVKPVSTVSCKTSAPICWTFAALSSCGEMVDLCG